MRISRRWRKYMRAPYALNHAASLLLMQLDSNHGAGAVIIVSGDAHEKAMGALSKYRMATPRRGT
jgi:hypothetical protein